MSKRVILSLGLGVCMTTVGPAAFAGGEPSGEGVHVHRGEAKRVRSPSGYTSSFRVDAMHDALKKALSGESSSSSSGSSWSSSSSSESSKKSSYSSDSKSSRSSDDEGGSSWRSYFSSKSSSSPKVVTRGDETGLAKYSVRPAVFGGSGGTYGSREEKIAELGKLIAGEGWPLLTGGGNGNPQTAQKAAKKAGAYTVGFAQASSLDDHHSSGRPSEHLSTLYVTGTGRGVGTIEREAPLAEQTNIAFFAGGSVGTLGELMASLYKPGVLAFLKGTGGVADAAVSKILPHLGPLPSNIQVVSDSDPKELIKKSRAALDKIPEKDRAFPSEHVRVGARQVFKDPEAVRKGFNVISYLVDRQGMKASDVEKLKTLTGLLNDPEASIAGRKPFVMIPDREGLTAEIAQDAIKRKVTAFAISGRGPKRNVQRDGVLHVNLDKGEGVGESAVGREVTQDARVVVVAGGDYKTLSHLVYALHTDTIVAVLESGGLSSGLREDIMPVISDKSHKAKVIYSSDPRELYSKIKRELDPPKWESKSYEKKYESKKSSWERDREDDDWRSNY
jgi:hypothetical protein